MDKRITELPGIKLGSRPRVLLVGNGINRAYNTCKSAEELIKAALSRGKTVISYDLIRYLPFPMQIIAATGNDVKSEMKEILKEMRNISVPDEQRVFIKKLLSCGFDAILTTNYSAEIEKAVFGNEWSPRYAYTDQKENPRTHFCNYRYTPLPLDKPASLWHIHGIANNADTTVIGNYYYGKLLSLVSNYAGRLIGDLKRCEAKDGIYQPKSWIDYFLLGDVYVMGFKMDFTESDIWWLLDYKSQHSAELFDAKTVIFEPNLSPDKIVMLKTYRCEVRDDPALDFSSAYREYYSNVTSMHLCGEV